MGTDQGVVIWEVSTDKFTLPCVKHVASGKQLDRRKLSSVSCDDLEGWDGGWRE